MLKNSGFTFIWVLIVPFVCLLSCSKEWLDEKTDIKLAVPSTLKDFQAILDNTAILNRNSPALGEIASDCHFVLENRFQFLPNFEKAAYTWTKQEPFNDVFDWADGYKNIYYCNVVLDGVKKYEAVDSGQQVKWNDVKGQALFHRAKNHFELAQIFAPPFKFDSPGSELGLPLRLGSDINYPTTRSTLRETYNQILEDLLKAKEILPINPLFKTRPSKLSTLAMLSRVYLSIEDYQSAEQYSEEYLNINRELIDYNTLNPLANFPFTLYNKEVVFHSEIKYWSSIGLDLRVDSNLYSLYDTNDLRRVIYFNINPDRSISFKGMYHNKDRTQFSGVATDEIYLIRAECLARRGNTTNAMKDLNDLLRTRWKRNNGVSSYVDQIASSAADALNRIVEERKKELLFRGIRWSDLRRLNKDDRFKVDIRRMVAGVLHTLMPNSLKYTFPIPDDIIQFTGIQQNPGW